jgi:hypothetical protein
MPLPGAWAHIRILIASKVSSCCPKPNGSCILSDWPRPFVALWMCRGKFTLISNGNSQLVLRFAPLPSDRRRPAQRVSAVSQVAVTEGIMSTLWLLLGVLCLPLLLNQSNAASKCAPRLICRTSCNSTATADRVTSSNQWPTISLTADLQCY